MGFSAGISSPGFQLRSTLKLFTEAFDPGCWAVLHFASLSVREASVDAGPLSKAIRGTSENMYYTQHALIQGAWFIATNKRKVFTCAVGCWQHTLQGFQEGGSRDRDVFPAVTRLDQVHQDSGSSCSPLPPGASSCIGILGRFRGSHGHLEP